MAISMYALTVPVFQRYLNNLDAILAKAEDEAAARKIGPAVLDASRLAPDMHPLTFQIQSTTDRMKFTLARLTGRTPPSWDDNEVTIADMRERIARARDFVGSITEADLAGSEDKAITVKRRGEEVTENALEHVTLNAVPQIFFHVSMAYAILRHNGIQIGKRDFTG